MGMALPDFPRKDGEGLSWVETPGGGRSPIVQGDALPATLNISLYH